MALNLNVELIHRKGTTAEWASSQYVLKAGEFGYDTEANIIKMGNGTDLWSALKALSFDGDVVDTNTTYTFAEGTVNGEFSVTPSDGAAQQVKVHGLGSAAYTESTAYATAAQGALADSALQKADITTGGANGTIAVDGSDVAVKGLAGLAYKAQIADADVANGAAIAQSKIAGLETALAGKASTTVTDGLNTRLTTAEGEIDDIQAQLGDLTGAMHFVGASTTDPTLEGGPTIEGHQGEYESGDVCLFGQKEYIFDGTNWILFGDEGSYLTKSEAQTTYLTKTDASNTYATKAALEDVVDGTTPVAKATTADNYNSASGTIKTKFDSVDAAVSAAQDAADAAQTDADANAAEIANIKNGTTVVAKATGDAAGNDIAATYATKEALEELDSKVDSLPAATVTDVTATPGDAVSVSKAGTVYTVAHKAYTTGKVSVTADEPYFIDSVTVEKGHVTSATAKSLAAALAELGTLTLNGGKADGTW